jgi:hypothetical protein
MSDTEGLGVSDNGGSVSHEVGDNTVPKDTDSGENKEINERISFLKKEKRRQKTNITKKKNQLLCSCSNEFMVKDEARKCIDSLWVLLENCFRVFEDLGDCYHLLTNEQAKLDIEKECDDFEKDLVSVIQKVEDIVNNLSFASVYFSLVI